jgi:hypothetical protein
MRLLPSALVSVLLTLATSAHAHPGHGAKELWHWHATDTFGLLMVAVLAGLAVWLTRGR